LHVQSEFREEKEEDS